MERTTTPMTPLTPRAPIDRRALVSRAVGTGIFNPGSDVVDYITKQLYKLPDMVSKRALLNRKKERYV